MINLRRRYYRLPVWLWGVIAALLLVGLITYAATRPQHGTWRFGACRALLETMVHFPSSINVIAVGESAQSAVVVYTDINAYGTQQIKVFECHYMQDAHGNTHLSRVVQNRRPYDDTVLADLNKKLPVILTQKLNTVYPPPPPARLIDVKR